MRRCIALILMLIVPLQFAWSAVAAVHGHVGEDSPTLGMHAHGHDHAPHGLDSSQHGSTSTSDLDSGHGEDGHHASHYHPVFSSILVESPLMPRMAVTGGEIPHVSSAFLSRIPPLPDRPPLALA